LNPLVSIIIPCLNEEDYIEGCLSSILNQNYPLENLQILVVDGGSTDQTKNILQELSVNSENIKILHNPKKITPISLNIGLSKSKGDYICILGAHSILDRNFIANGVKELASSQAMMVGGPVTHRGHNLMGRAIALAMQSPFGVGNSVFRTGSKKQFVDTAAFGLYRKEIFQLIGKFDESLVRNQDFELNQRIVLAGYPILFSPTIRSTYFTRNTLVPLFKQYFQYGYWKVQVIRKNMKTFKLRYQAPLLFIFLLFFLSIGSGISPQIWIVFKALMVTYLVIALFFSFHATRWKNYLLIFFIPFVFLILHLSFGLGLCSGILPVLFKQGLNKVRH